MTAVVLPVWFSQGGVHPSLLALTIGLYFATPTVVVSHVGMYIHRVRWPGFHANAAFLARTLHMMNSDPFISACKSMGGT